MTTIDLNRIPCQWGLCWATCVAMLSAGVGETLTPCQVAGRCFDLQCCTGTPLADCGAGIEPADVRTVLNAFGFAASFVRGSVSLSKLIEETTAKRPVQVGLAWNAVLGHTMLVTGATADGRVMIHDPRAGCGVVTYQSLLDAFGAGSWEYTWTDIERRAP